MGGRGRQIEKENNSLKEIIAEHQQQQRMTMTDISESVCFIDNILYAGNSMHFFLSSFFFFLSPLSILESSHNCLGDFSCALVFSFYYFKKKQKNSKVCSWYLEIFHWYNGLYLSTCLQYWKHRVKWWGSPFQFDLWNVLQTLVGFLNPLW